MTAPVDLAVVVVTYGTPELLRANFDPAELSQVPARLIVVDNFKSAAERAEMAEVAATAGWDFVPMDGNAGFGAAMNRGVARAIELGCTAFVLLNPDAHAPAKVLSELRDACLDDPMALVGPRIVRENGRLWSAGNYVTTSNGRMVKKSEAILDAGSETPRAGVDLWLSGACVALSRQLWDAIGGFDDRYFLYWEDVDLSLRAVAAGARIVIRNDLEVVHAVGGTQGDSYKSEIYYYYNTRNRLLFAAANLPRTLVVRWMLTTPAASWQIVMRGGRRQLLHDRSGLYAACRGSVSGWRLAAASLATGARWRRAGA